VSWNYTTYVNIVFLLLAAALVWATSAARRLGDAEDDEQAHGRTKRNMHLSRP
jgi:hypothetical protein